MLVGMDRFRNPIAQVLERRLKHFRDVAPRPLNDVIVVLDGVVRETGTKLDYRAKGHQPLSSSSAS
jgi:hypothetical protein